jgi:protein-L-isoaspartate O-methyltransferase
MRIHRRLACVCCVLSIAFPCLPLQVSRRHALTIGGVWILPIHAAHGTEDKTGFRSNGYGREEYTNSIVASRDTNISPAEVYDTLAKLRTKDGIRALDMGAGAGVSTQVLWELGYREIDALDWSGDAWRTNVEENGSCPSSVHFYELDDERFLKQWKGDSQSKRYDAIAFNFAVNRKKAVFFAKKLLNVGGILLAPINTQDDYWLKQVYTLMDSSGETLWVANDVGAWSVQFQPDVTQDTCQGVWCAQFNGFQKLRTYPTTD